MPDCGHVGRRAGGSARGLFWRVAVSCCFAVVILSLAGCGENDWRSSRAKHFTVETKLGQSVALQLDGKPAMGYFWKLNEARSRYRGLVEIKDLGWTFKTDLRGSDALTKPAVLRYAVAARKAGTATLVFEYFRKEPGASPSAVWTYDIVIASR